MSTHSNITFPTPLVRERFVKRVIRALAQAAILLLVTGCSSTEVRGAKGGHSPPDLDRAEEELRIVIRWGGEGLTSGKDVDRRTKREALVKERGIGKAVRSGVEMGWMSIWIEVKDRDKARKALEAIMEDVAASIAFWIEWALPSERLTVRTRVDRKWGLPTISATIFLSPC